MMRMAWELRSRKRPGMPASSSGSVGDEGLRQPLLQPSPKLQLQPHGPFLPVKRLFHGIEDFCKWLVEVFRKLLGGCAGAARRGGGAALTLLVNSGGMLQFLAWPGLLLPLPAF